MNAASMLGSVLIGSKEPGVVGKFVLLVLPTTVAKPPSSRTILFGEPCPTSEEHISAPSLPRNLVTNITELVPSGPWNAPGVCGKPRGRVPPATTSSPMEFQALVPAA